MRQLIVHNIVSLDGFYEGPGNDVMALPMDPFFDSYNAERLRAASTLLLGGATYRLFRSYWPSIADDSEQRDIEREISRRNNTIQKVVVSDTLKPDDTAPWTDTTRILRRVEAAASIAELKQEEGGDVLMFGSHTLWNALLAAGLVDELHLMVGAAVLGGGTSAFDRAVSGLRLLDARTQDGSSNVVLRYAVPSS